mgnify:CR=1 FL=1
MSAYILQQPTTYSFLYQLCTKLFCGLGWIVLNLYVVVFVQRDLGPTRKRTCSNCNLWQGVVDLQTHCPTIYCVVPINPEE